jgi:hypothetical protein
LKPGGAATARAVFVRSARDVEMRKERLNCLPRNLLLDLEGEESMGSGDSFLAPDKIGIVDIRLLLVMYLGEGEKELDVVARNARRAITFRRVLIGVELLYSQVYVVVNVAVICNCIQVRRRSRL